MELSARRGMGDAEIAELLRVDVAEVRRRHNAAMLELARSIDVSVPELRHGLEQLTPADWEGRAVPAETTASQSGAGRKEGRRLSTMAAAGAALLAIGAVIAAIALAASRYDGDSDDDPKVAQDPTAATETAAPTDTQTATAADPPPEQATRTGPRVTFQRLNGTFGRGTAQLTSKGDSARLRVRVTSLLQPVGGGYALWVLNSPADARQLLSTRATRVSVDLRLPPGYARYRYVELSREPTDDPSHGGLSLLRAPIEALTAD